MKKSNAKNSWPTAALFGMYALATPTWAATIDASSCSQSDVESAINSASDGDTVAVPHGNCTWSTGFSISKGIHLKGAGSSNVAINMGGTLTITKNPSYNVRLSGFTFNRAGGGNSFKVLFVTGAWSAQPPLIHDNVFSVSDAGTILYTANGGVIFNNVFNGKWDDSAIQHKLNNDTESWSAVDTMGENDTNGQLNLYVENNVFNGMSNQCTDFDDAARVVFRYNTLNSSSFNSHGLATSPIGVRHYEVYNNDFNYPDNTVNQNWFVWLRGGTGVMYNNSFDDITGQMWGDKKEILFSVRSVNDGGVLGCCTSYACPHQVGQNHNGTSQFTDPVRLWNNTGTQEWAIQEWPDNCGQNINDYLQEGRDFVFASTPKIGYVPYTYPHPLIENNLETLLQAPTDLHISQ